MTKTPVGISGLSVYVPPLRVWLDDWSQWTENQWPKIREVVGRSFRMRGINQSVYTMAANAVMRLIKQYSNLVAIDKRQEDLLEKIVHSL